MIRDILRFLWRRDSESAAILCIMLASFLSRDDVKHMADYFKAVYVYDRDQRRIK